MVWRTAATTAAAGLLAVSALAAPSNAEAATAPRTVPAAASQATTPESVQRFGACLAGGAPGDLLVLMDRSGSLKDSDPDNARVTAAKYLVEQLANLSARNSLNLEVAVAGFDTTFEKVTGWMPVTTGRNDLLASIGTFAEANRGVDTDYWNAMSGARRELAARGAGADGRCSGVVVFTDGEYSLYTRGGDHPGIKDLGGAKPYDRGNKLATEKDLAAAIRAGQKDICRPGGVADQVRSQDITTFGIGLSGEAKPNFEFFRNMTTGEGGCGKITTPSPGAFFEAANIRDLFFAFNQVAGGGTPAVEQDGKVCATGECPEGTHTFVLDASIGQVHALADSDATGATITVVSPSGTTLELARDGAGSGSVPGGKVTWQWLGEDSVSVDIERTEDAPWVGAWGLRFEAPNAAGKVSRSSLRVFGDLVPAWPAAAETALRSGEKVDDLTFAVQHVDGSPVDPAALSDKTTLSASLVLADGTAVPVGTDLSGAAISAPQSLDLTGVTPGPATLRLALAVTTNDWSSLGTTVPGTVLEPQVKDYSVTVATPPNYPEVAKQVTFGKVSEAGSVTADVAVDGTGCVWVEGEPTVTTAPADAPGIRVSAGATDAEGCVPGPLTLTFSTDGVGDGLVSGTASVMVLPEDRTAPAVAVPVAFTAEMERPLNPGYFALALVGLTVLGVAIPVALLYLAKYLTAKIPGPTLAAGSVRGAVPDSGGSFLDAPLALATHELQNQALPEGGARTLTIDGKTLTTKAGRGLTEPGHVVVEHPGRISAAGPNGARSKDNAKLPLAVQNHWCVALDALNPRTGDVEVTFFTTAGAPGWDELVAAARRDLPDVVRTMRGRLPQDASDGDAASPTAADVWSAPVGAGAPAVDPWSSPAGSSAGQSGGTGGLGAPPGLGSPIPGSPPVMPPPGTPGNPPGMPGSPPQPPSGW